MKNVNLTIPASEVAKLVEEYINKQLSPNQRSKAFMINSTGEPSSLPGTPNTALYVQFDTVEI